ncbi:13702_t:CDS:1, partial [Dentiscutata erythropus]
PNCDCKTENIASCTRFSGPAGRYCGSELSCLGALANHIYQLNSKENFCHFGPCTNGCEVDRPNSKCK